MLELAGYLSTFYLACANCGDILLISSIAVRERIDGLTKLTTLLTSA